MKHLKQVAAIVVLVGIWACSEVVGDPAAELPDLGTQTIGAVEASFRVGPFMDGRQSVWIRLTGVEGRVGAYQATLRFDASRLTLDRAVMTDHQGTGDFGVMNEGHTAQGLFRFAGFSIEGFDVRDVVELAFQAPRPLESGDLKLELDVVGTPDGGQVAPDALVVTSAMQPVVKLELGR